MVCDGVLHDNFGLEDLFQEQVESEEDHVYGKMGSNSILDLSVFDFDDEEETAAEKAERLKREKEREAEEKKRKEEESIWRRKKHESVIKSISK